MQASQELFGQLSLHVRARNPHHRHWLSSHSYICVPQSPDVLEQLPNSLANLLEAIITGPRSCERCPIVRKTNKRTRGSDVVGHGIPDPTDD